MRGSNLLLFFGWLILIAIGVVTNRLSPLRPEMVEPVWEAARDLPANTVITAEDLKTPPGLVDARGLPPLDELVGKHLWVDKPAGSKVEPSDVHARPNIPDAAVSLVYPVPAAQAVLAEVLAPGDQVYLCALDGTEGSEACTGPLGVLATHTGAAPHERWLLLDIAGHDAELWRILDAKRHFVLRAGSQEVGEPEPSVGAQ